MKLIDILIQELPKRGGWPEGAEKYCSYNGEAGAYKPGGIEIKKALITGIDTQICDVVYAGQYEAALDAKNDGWIEWGGGECPVPRDTMVDVIFGRGGIMSTNIADCWRWNHSGTDSDIIAYRLQQPGIDTSTNDDRLEQDLNECIGQGVDIPEWNGDGLPPVGVKCEHCPGGTTQHEWEVVTVAGVYENLATGFTDYWLVRENGSSYIVGNPYRFRPLRTEAEMAREKLAASLHIAAGASPIELNGIGPLYFKLADAIISGSVFGTTFKAGK